MSSVSRSRKNIRFRADSSLDDLSFFEAFKQDWDVFWSGLLSSEMTIEETPEGEVKRVAQDPAHIKKLLSEKRKEINRALETIKKEIELNRTKLETLKLVGGDWKAVESHLEKLNSEGAFFAEQMQALDKKALALRESERQQLS